MWGSEGTGFAGEKEEENEFLLPKVRIRTVAKHHLTESMQQRLICRWIMA